MGTSQNPRDEETLELLEFEGFFLGKQGYSVVQETSDQSASCLMGEGFGPSSLRVPMEA